MKTEHLSEIEGQQYVLNKTNCERNIIEHIESCAECAAEAENYRLMFAAIKQQPKPVFDFDVSQLVLARLPQSKSSFSLNFLFYFLFAVALGSIGLLAYVFRQYLLKIFTGILPMVMYMIITITVAILIFQGIEIYRKYQKQMRSLNSF